MTAWSSIIQQSKETYQSTIKHSQVHIQLVYTCRILQAMLFSDTNTGIRMRFQADKKAKCRGKYNTK
jgi:hypothetical protein